jgi:hypothetical protein
MLLLLYLHRVFLWVTVTGYVNHLHIVLLLLLLWWEEVKYVTASSSSSTAIIVWCIQQQVELRQARHHVLITAITLLLAAATLILLLNTLHKPLHAACYGVSLHTSSKVNLHGHHLSQFALVLVSSSSS